jgi:hypothetical protein
VNRHRSSTARLAATALVVGLVGLAGTACGGHGIPATSGAPATSQAAQTSATGSAISADPTASAPVSTIAVASPSASASGSVAPSMVAAASKAPAAAATPDPLDAELKGLDQIVNDVNGSISGTDASSSGGE